MKILLDDELKKIVEHDKIDELQRAINFVVAEGLQSCLYTSKFGIKVAINIINGDVLVKRLG